MILSAGGSEGGVVAGVEDDLGLGKDGVVFDLGLPDGGAVVGEDDELGLARSEGPEGGFVAEGVLATLDDQTQFAVDVVTSCFLWHSFSNVVKIILI